MPLDLTVPDERDRAVRGVSAPGSPLGAAPDAALLADPELQPDGSALVQVPEEPEQANPRHFDNLVGKLDVSERSRLAQDVWDYVDRDKQAREKRDKLYRDAIERSGLSGEAPGGARFDGASRVVHPMLAEACVDFAARVMKELFPPDGPVKAKIWGRASEDKQARAERKSRWLNWQLTAQRGRQAIREFRDELEQAVTQLPLAGSEFLKIYHDGRRIRAECVTVDRMLLPYAAVSFYTSPRITHWQQVTRQEFERRVAAGQYEEPSAGVTPSNEPEGSASDAAREKVEGKEPTAYNEDGLRDIYEMQISLEIDADKGGDGPRPYVVTLDEASRELLAVRRNWAPDDEDEERLDHFVKLPFIPWSGAYDLGLWHLIGSLSVAATGALRALLDSAHINNAASALKLRGRGAGQSVTPEIGEITDIDAPPGTDDIRKVAMPFPFNPPSPVLFQLLEWVTAAGKGVVNTAEEKIADVSATAPVGTTLAMIEQGAVTYSAVHSRLHAAQAKALEIISRLNATHLDEEDAAKELGGEDPPRRKDFLPPYDTAPVSDPAVFSDTQRYAQNQGILQLSADQRVKYNVTEVHRRILRTMKVDDVDSLLPPLPTPRRMDPVAENVASFAATPLAAFPDQDHLAHMKTHLDFMLSPVGGGNAVLGPRVVIPLLDHCAQHLVFFYLAKMQETGRDVAAQTGLPQDELLAAATSEAAKASMVQDLQPLMQQFAAATQMAQQYAPKPPADPRATALLEAAKLETQRRAAADATSAQLKQAELQQGAALKQAELQQSAALERSRQRNDVYLEITKDRARQQLELDSAQRAEADAQRQQAADLLLARMNAMNDADRNNADNVQRLVTEILKNHEDNVTKLVITNAAASQSLGAGDGKRTGADVARASEETFRKMEALLERAKSDRTEEIHNVVQQGLQELLRFAQAPRVLEYDAEGNPVRSVIARD